MMDRAAASEIIEAGGFEVRRFVLNELLTNGFVIRHVDSGQLAIIDPGAKGDVLVDAAREMGGDVRHILITHHHGDHWADLGVVRSAVDAPVTAPPGAPYDTDRAVAGGEALSFGGDVVAVHATPGHSPESVSFRIGPHVFVGDFLFRLGSGRTDNPGASTADLFAAVREVFAALPDDTRLWCGHGPPSNMADERARNPFWAVALKGLPAAPVDKVVYRGRTVPVYVWADDYDGGRKALLELAGGALVIVPGSQVERPS